MKRTVKAYGYEYNLSLPLIKKMNLCQAEVDDIVKLHEKKLLIYTMAKNTESSPLLKALAEELKEVEFQMQDKWGFDRDARWHAWHYIPKCDCAKLDNDDMRGTNYQIINTACPIHGDY